MSVLGLIFGLDPVRIPGIQGEIGAQLVEGQSSHYFFFFQTNDVMEQDTTTDGHLDRWRNITFDHSKCMLAKL